VSRPSILFKYRTLSNYGFQPCILTLPTEAIENIFLQVDQLDDLHSLTCVNRFFASIACPIYTKRHKIHVTVNLAIVHIRGDSFRALATSRRSRLFTNIRDKHLYCISMMMIMKQLKLSFERFKNFFRYLSLGDCLTP
jgi:hypothetical protein